ncbi:MAG TPA: 2-C-methyl-D-erythritol 4-phosphate cytidylyltransferase [Dehalococcoidales bacterium]|nr:2-C-methyl-D-erythritol 4-phosphate cytidylyltransferase [Dehalococcoidales bacterium]
MSTGISPGLSVGAIVVAAGSSSRMNGLDKILAPLGGKPLLAWSVEALQKSPRIDRIVVVASQSNLETIHTLVKNQKWNKVVKVCQGGRRRQDSVIAGLKLVEDCEWIVIHDGARPFLTQDLINDGLEAAVESGAAVAAVPVTDTIKVADDNLRVVATPDRSYLWTVQTPQVFRFSIISQASRHSAGDVTDDAGLVEKTGVKVKLFRGSYGNIKITTPQDLAVAEILSKSYA